MNEFDRAVFVSNNYKEFGKDSKEDGFHSDLTQYFENVEIIYERDFKNLLDLTEDMEYELQMYFDYLHENKIGFHCRMEDCNSMGIFDSKIRVSDGSLEYEDRMQLKFFQLSEVPYSPKVKFVQSGRCKKCNSIHIECPECKNLLIDFEEDNILFCDNCQIRFERAYSNRNNDEIIIPINDDIL
ncbi:MAG TPA: hypothetical protein PK079_10675 [Leptospiraceae bacterium]|nr:hypothetical protein [Leptospiraceae bacterium]HMW05903.1 hypothetical protein [Leptospiraceae bacterium]HMX32681.1 hypothetical protein [Leptospiraceae bacterium]HMY32732.1 hypothetical protein [Leptospiraceae bacterium]HMZ62539.1 hypothetical protein [Leptospiraceae bacterium]